MSSKASIYIDGGNFYHLVLKKMGLVETDIDFEAFAKYLAGDREIVEMGKRYYIGTVREKEGDARSKEAMSRQTSLFTKLMAGKWQIKTSKLRERVERVPIDSRVADCEKLKKLGITEIKYTRNREKGIDVKLASDLFIGGMDDKYDVAIVVSSDTDLVPAIDIVRHRLNKQVEYVGFSIPDPNGSADNTKPILSLISRTDTQRILTDADIRKFVIPKIK